jgi:hypothetical protein
MERTVLVGGISHTIDVDQSSKTVWVAVGEYKGERHEAKGRTEYDAVSNWRERARSTGN